jgi:protoporphyrin/coproporphyrin ferrochelatase
MNHKMEPHTAVLLMAYGSPNSLDEVGEYLQQVRGRSPTDADIERLRERYRIVGGSTPLLQITLAQARALQSLLNSNGHSAKVHVGMKHWHPFIQEAISEIVREEPSEIVGLAMAPHYSKLSIGGYERAVVDALKDAKAIPFTMVRSWHTQPDFVHALSRKISSALSTKDPSRIVVLFTAHSLPKSAVATDDPYESQLKETSRLVAESAGVGSWDFAFQSAGEPVNSWLGPLIKDKILELSGKNFRDILVCPIGFVSDHLEILYDLDIEAKEYGRSLGVDVTRTPSLNDDQEFIQALAETVKPLLAKPLAIA